MPVSVVVGGQFGSEGKGKVAHFIAKEVEAAAAVRVGGPNSGHTVVDGNGTSIVLRQLPTAAILPKVLCVLPAGSYLDLEVLKTEIEMTGLSTSRLVIDPLAMLIKPEDKAIEKAEKLGHRLGSTLSGTGAAVQRRISRDESVAMAKDEPCLREYIQPVQRILRMLLDHDRRIVIEGTQGFGLSLLHGDYPKVTSRDTTAAGFVAETGLSPLDVDDVVLVVRSFPIRVPGNSGTLLHEIDWETLTSEAGSESPLVEYTSVTRGRRRVARFDENVVRRAIAANRPTRFVLNHLDYIDARARETARPTERILAFVRDVERLLAARVHYYGLSPSIMVPADDYWRLEKAAV